MSDQKGFFDRNKAVSFAIIIACMLFIGIFFLEKSKQVINLIPKLRGEVAIGNNFVITTTASHYPIIIRKDDPKLGEIRFSGTVRLKFDKIVHSLYSNNSVIVEVGAHFGERTLEFGHRVKQNGKVYAFEPNYQIFSNIRKSVILNDLEHAVILKNIALSDHSGSININDRASAGNLENGKQQKQRTIAVDCNTLDGSV